jgi:hypothetical protein
MDKAICQHALDRVMLYLQNYGIDPSPAVCRRALGLIDDCLGESGVEDSATCDTERALPGLLAMVFDRLPKVFDLPELNLPVQRPPILRGSIGYGPAV